MAMDSPRILIVDDEALVLTILERQLVELQVEIVAESNPLVAVDRVKEQEFAVVLSDNIMPQMQGLEFLSIVMSLHPDTRRILVTGYTDHQQAIEAFNHGVLHRYIQKPWDRGAMVETVRAQLETFGHMERERLEVQALEDSGALHQAGLPGDNAPPALSQQGPSVDRKFSVVIVGDVAGFSRLMGDDHEATLSALTDCRTAISDSFSAQGGRMVNAVGDSILAEFESVPQAVTGALDAQHELARRNAPRPEHRKMHFRFGINRGTVLVRAGELYGTVVNVAARLQELASSGGICVSEEVARELGHGGSYRLESFGTRNLKNIADPVQVYALLNGDATGRSA